MMIQHLGFPVLGMLVSVSTLALAQEGGNMWDGENAASMIRATGLDARLHENQRNANIQAVSAAIGALAEKDRERLRALQGDFQYALMLVADPEIYETLSPETIESVDEALEKVFNLEEINRSTEWEPLIYAYGFFNRDVTAAEILEVKAQVERLSYEERTRLYPSFPHTIDAVTKPLSMGGLQHREETLAALRVAVPLLREMLTAPPAPGRAYHVPSHATLVLGPIYDQWEGDPDAAAILREHLGERKDLIQLMMNQLVGSRENRDNLEPFEYGYYGYSGAYIANGLARLGARDAVDVLRKSLAVYEAHDEKRAADYTRRALAALGDTSARKALEDALTAGDAGATATALWLARNAAGEGAEYGRLLLGRILESSPEEALRNYFEQERERLNSVEE